MTEKKSLLLQPACQIFVVANQMVAEGVVSVDRAEEILGN